MNDGYRGLVDSSKGNNEDQPLIGVVGVCASGKTTVIEGLASRGYRVRHIAQEHSYVKDMWRRITNPDFLIYLDVSFEVARQRRSMDWTETDYLEQKKRLAHAHDHADLRLDTTTLSPELVIQAIVDFLSKQPRG